MDSIASDFENWGPYLMKQFQQMYDKGERCDLEISCNKQIFLVHRLILAACSEYVRDLGDKQHIILPDEVSCKAVKSIIDFVYTGKIMFCKDEKEDLLLASNLLHMRLLTELIKMEESCSFTLSMDDENEESKSGENANSVDLDLHDSTDLASDDKFSDQPASSQTVKKKDVRSGRPRPNRNTVLPPLFKFPYLHQKFSSTRTYGLITILTDFVPSRLDVPQAILQSCQFQSSFDDISYGTSIMCSYDSMDAPLQPAHLEFLKKIKESPQRRSFASALFSPFDKYTPPYNTSSDVLAAKKRDSVTSYLSTIDVPAYKRPALKTSQPTPKKSVTFAPELEIIVECPRSYPSDSPKRPPIQPTPVEIPKPLAELPETTAAIDVAVETTPSDIDMELPAPLSPVTNISGDLMQASFVESGEKIELTNLRNVAMPMEIEELDHPTVIEYQPESSVVTVGAISTNGLNEPAPADTLSTCEDITMVYTNESDMIQDIPMATDEVGPSESTAVSDFASTEQITKEFETEPQNLDATTSPETATAAVCVAETTAEASAVAEKNETEIAALPDDTKPLIVSETEYVVAGDSKATEHNSSSEVADTTATTADVNLVETAYLSPPIIPPAAEIAQQSLSNDDDVCEAFSEKPSSDAGPSALELPPSVESAPQQQQLPCAADSTETTQQKAPANNQVASTINVSSSSSIAPLSVISAAEPAMPTVSSTTSRDSNSSETTVLPNIVEKPTDNDDSSAPSTSNKCHNVAPKSASDGSTLCPKEVIMSDSTVFTPLDAKQVSHISTEPNSQIFAIKVKGTENQTQLSQLVDLCRKNPLFKNKNVKFKIVPVKGPITKTLQESSQLSGSVLNKAIIVQKTTSSKYVNSQVERVAVANATVPSPATKAAVIKGVSAATNKRPDKTWLLENVTGPWECSRCHEEGSPLPVKLNSYFEYRTHLHQVHNEPNSPVFCMYCGYKSLKRNQQLYHLLLKHQVEPPSNVQFPKCDKCNFYALNEYSLQKHQSVHQSVGMEYVCTCRAAFKSGDLLQQHMASNVCKNSSSFSCGYCNSQFGRVVNLKAHMRVCMKERAKVPQCATFIDAVRPSEEEPEMILP